MTSNKKRKLFRILAVCICLALLAGGAFTVSSVQEAGYRALMGAVPKVETGSLPTADGDASDPALFSELDPLSANGDYEKVAENQTLILYLSDDNTKLKLYDKQADFIWSAVVEDQEVLSSSLPESTLNAMQSMLTFKYIDLEASSPVEKETYSNVEPVTIIRNRVLNGVRLYYDFSALNIEFAVDFLLNDHRLVAQVAEDTIVEQTAEENSGNDPKQMVESTVDTLIADCEAFHASVEDDGSMDDMLKTLVELTMGEVIEHLTTQLQLSLTGAYDEQKTISISEGLDQLAFLFDPESEQYRTLTDLKARSEMVCGQMQEIAENRATGITSLQVLPYFGAQTSSVDGYAFYPDKCGSISYFNRVHPDMAGVYQQDVYSVFSESEVHSVVSDAEQNYTAEIKMPVYGVKAENAAFLAIIDKGDTDSAITYNPCGEDKNIANINGTYYLRKKTTIVNSGGGQTRMFDSDRTRGDWVTVYEFLNGDRANYSGMASAYQSYLLQTGQLERSDVLDRGMPLGLEFFIGAENERQSVIREYILMTDFAYIQDYLERLTQSGIQNIMVSMESWTRRAGVLSKEPLKPARQAGGKNSLKRLGEYAAENDILLGLNHEMLWVSREDMSSAEIDVTTVKNKGLLTFEILGWHLFNPQYAYNRLVRQEIPQFQELNVSALRIESASDKLMYDYNRNAPLSRKDSAEIFTALAATVQEQLGGTFAHEANAYMFRAVDWNMGVSSQHSAFLYSDEVVPFYQLVTHGYIPCTGTAFNDMYDPQEQLLKNVEFGYLPFYYLTENKPFEIRDAGYDQFYATTGDDWFDAIVETYSTFQEDFSEIWNLPMVRHERLSEELVRVTYENGSYVLINYSELPATVDGNTVGPESYLVISE